MSLEWSKVPDFSYLQHLLETLNYYLLAAQTIVVWVSHHPYWAVAIAILALTLLQTLLSLTSTLVRQAVLWLLKAPFQLISWLVIQGFRSTQKAIAPAALPTTDDQINHILQQLETLRHQQDALLAELKILLDTNAASNAPIGVHRSKTQQRQFESQRLLLSNGSANVAELAELTAIEQPEELARGR